MKFKNAISEEKNNGFAISVNDRLTVGALNQFPQR